MTFDDNQQFQESGSRRRRTKTPPFTTYNSVAQVVGSLHQYQDIPYNFRKQWITIFLALVVVVGLIASLYLNIVSRTALAGREIQSMEDQITMNQRINADYQTRIAQALSSESLRNRAVEAGYVDLKVEDLGYMIVQGYIPTSKIDLSVHATASEDTADQSEYTESLFTWIAKEVESASVPLATLP